MTTTADPCYLYGFIRTPHQPLPAVTGVFGAPVHTRDADGLSAVVSPLPDQDLRAARRDLMAHSDVLQALIADHDVVPAGFGTVYPAGFRIEDLPAAQRRSLVRLIDSVAGRVEVQVKATYDETGVTQAIVAGDARLRRLRQRGQDYSTRLAVGTRFAEQLERRRGSDTAMVAKRLRRVAERVSVDPPAGEWGAFRLSLLVSRRRLDDVDRALQELAGELESVMTLSWVGPLPPYSFVQDGPSRKRGR